MRAIGTIVLLVLATTLGGCTWVGAGATSRLIDPLRPDVARIVYGVRDESSPRRLGDRFWPVEGYYLTMREVDPISGDLVCVSGGLNVGTTAQSGSSPSSLRYFVFDVPPGAYRLGPVFTGPVYLAPKGETVYIGDYLIPRTAGDLSTTMGFSRDLPAAKAALGRLATSMTLAEVSTGAVNYGGGVCRGQGISYDYSKPVAVIVPPRP